jgi:uncharacterized protein
MKLQPDRIDVPAITAYGEDWVAIAGERVQRSVVLSSTGQRFDWDCASFEALSATHFARLEDLPVDILLFGSGPRQRFVSPAWLAGLMQRRTYNILAGEGRKVAVALLLHAAPA